ncbi:MAG: YitT family protein, partial [Clostridia bacterium]|nr:YitT family protein [Clostridia bacterium]
MYRRYQQGTVLVVTEKAQEICDAIYREYHHGATILTGEGSHIHKDRKIVYSVVSRAETTGVVQVVRSIDPDAFINIMDTKQVAGR